MFSVAYAYEHLLALFMDTQSLVDYLQDGSLLADF